MIVETDPLIEKYFEEIEHSSGLSSEAEADICRRMAAGDEEAMGELVRANLRFVVRVAKQYRGMGLPFSDLINEGNLGMIVAAQRFDITLGYRFISYAVWWVRHAILKALADHSRTVRLPNNRVIALARLLKTSQSLEQQLGRLPDSEELASALEIPTEEIDLLSNLDKQVFSLDTPPTTDGTQYPLSESLPDTSRPSIEDHFCTVELKEQIRNALGQLSESEAIVVGLYFGIEDGKTMTLEQIGTQIGRTRERVRQIKVKALQQLRRSSHGQQLRVYLQTD
jgi:RNA polymerase primary sigma factor